jgi:ribose transport system ATP-binding protein
MRGLSKTFGATRALKNADFDIARGEVHALVGQNGSGKSTLIKLLAGYYQPDADTQIDCCGHKFALGNPRAAHEAGLRFVHQDLGLVSMLHTMDNLALGFGYATGVGRHIRWRAQRQHAKKALNALGYQIDVTEPLANLSPVERTAVAIARALQGIEPASSVLILDEPTATMPKPEVQRMFQIVSALRENGVSVLYVSHHLDEVYQLADRITVLRDGQVIDTRPADSLPRAELVELMVGDVQRERLKSRTHRSERVVLNVANLTTGRLHDASLQIHEGEIVGVAGITGSGREELCDALFGGRPRTGSVIVNGNEIEAMRPDIMVRNRVGLVPADRREMAMFETMSVRENFTAPDISQFWRALILRHKAERDEVAGLIDRMRVKAPGTEAGMDALSGGNQQKVIVGRWLRLDSAVLLLDDPTQGVDVAAKSEIHRLIDSAAAGGTAVLVCSTDEEELERLCHRVVILRNGQIAAQLRGSAATAAKIARETLGTNHLNGNSTNAVMA